MISNVSANIWQVVAQSRRFVGSKAAGLSIQINRINQTRFAETSQEVSVSQNDRITYSPTLMAGGANLYYILVPLGE